MIRGSGFEIVLVFDGKRTTNPLKLDDTNNQRRGKLDANKIRLQKEITKQQR